MRISDWSSDVCSSDLFLWVIRADPIPNDNRRRRLPAFDDPTSFRRHPDVPRSESPGCRGQAPVRRTTKLSPQRDRTDEGHPCAPQLPRGIYRGVLLPTAYRQLKERGTNMIKRHLLYTQLQLL